MLVNLSDCTDLDVASRVSPGLLHLSWRVRTRTDLTAFWPFRGAARRVREPAPVRFLSGVAGGLRRPRQVRPAGPGESSDDLAPSASPGRPCHERCRSAGNRGGWGCGFPGVGEGG